MKPVVGIIGGTGLAELVGEGTNARTREIVTPFGPPSAPIVTTTWEGLEVAFLSRHGRGHTIPPSSVPFRANILAFKMLGATHILASGAAGSLREEIRPRELVVPDQVIDRTFKRASTFFDEGVAVHVEFAEPFCPALRRCILSAARSAGISARDGGTYVCMEGPQFSTVAEANMHRAWGGDLIGMTCMPEAKLAREAEIAYALIALPTDYDCWRPHQPGIDKQTLLAEIISNLQDAAHKATELIRATVRHLAAGHIEPSPCHDALNRAIWSDKSLVRKEVVEKLRPIMGRYFQA
jgi:5'-methylthioadenosine phosphorylase